MIQEPYEEILLEPDSDEPCYAISVVARMVKVHAQTLRYYERLGMLEPARSPGNVRIYSPRDVRRLQRIKSLMDDLGINLAGVEVIMRMSVRMVEMEKELQRLRAELGHGEAQEPQPKDAEGTGPSAGSG